VIEALIVGNETLLRGELSAGQVKEYIAQVKERSGLPVTYADVWDFWLRAPELVDAVDFVTIHILPYWEDHPVAAGDAVDHVLEVRRFVEERLPNKEIFIGEVGWPSAGRMRDGALPSRVNQALVLSGIVAAAKAEGWKANLIEAFDQPWKRSLEGTAGGHWGIFDNARREPKFHFGEPLSNHPDWVIKAALGAGVALIVFCAAWLGQRRRDPSWPRDLATGLIALAAGLTFGAAAVGLTRESVSFSDGLSAAALASLALAVPAATAFALARGNSLTGFTNGLTAKGWRNRDWVTPGLALLLAATVVVTIHIALGLVFDPRYKDFPVAALTGPVVGLSILAFFHSADPRRPGVAERTAAVVLAVAAVFIVINESVANWQAIWLAALLILLASAVLRAQAAPG
jgi:glucan 1,3-beta-glucosidase